MIKVKLDIQDKEGWIPQTSRFVGYVDIMGFKNYIAQTAPENIYVTMFNALNRIAEALTKTVYEDRKQLLRMTTYSDSIIIYTKDDSEPCLYLILIALANLQDILIEEGLPFRGALTQGLMTLDLENSIFFGQPLVDAHLLQEEFSMYVIILHPSVMKKIDDYDEPTVIAIYIRQMWMDYNCFLKNGRSKHPVITPETVTRQNKGSQLVKILNKIKERTPIHLTHYIDNTNTYYQYVMQEWATMH
jgi:hypothetical protein